LDEDAGNVRGRRGEPDGRIRELPLLTRNPKRSLISSGQADVWQQKPGEVKPGFRGKKGKKICNPPYTGAWGKIRVLQRGIPQGKGVTNGEEGRRRVNLEEKKDCFRGKGGAKRDTWVPAQKNRERGLAAKEKKSLVEGDAARQVQGKISDRARRVQDSGFIGIKKRRMGGLSCRGGIKRNLFKKKQGKASRTDVSESKTNDLRPNS